MNPSYNADVAREFLERYRPEGPWVLTMIDSEQAPIESRTLTNLDDLPALLEEFNVDLPDPGMPGKTKTPRRNVYFSVNELSRTFHGRTRAGKEDVQAVTWFHVDVDPRVAEEREGRLPEEQKRILAEAQNPPGHLPLPTVVIMSGGGAQLFWKLDKPIEIGGKQAKWEDVERYTKQIQTLFKTEDSCYNVDRIMRVPGTVNWPNDKKRKKGRVPALAELVDFTDTSYPLSMFTPAVEVQQAGESVFGNEREIVLPDSGNIERVVDLQDLDQYDVGASVKKLIIHGDDEDKTKYPSRSEVLFAAVCGLVKKEVPNEVIYAIITDPDWPISESVLIDGNKRHRRGKNLERYAKRQIQRAHEKTGETEAKTGDALVEMNERHAIIGNYGGECVVIEEIYNNALKRKEFSKQTWPAIGNRYGNKFVEWTDGDGKTKSEPLVKWWKQHPKRNFYDRMEFAPGRELPSNILNLWQGFGVESIPGDCSLFLTHVRENICQGDEALYIYVMSWLARIVQKLDRPGETALVLRGEMGTGKNVFADAIGRLFGQHYMEIASAEHLTGRFNAHTRDIKYLVANEAFYAGDKNHRSTLKALVTSGIKLQEAKGVDAEVAANYVALVMLSNEDWVVPAGLEERRFVVLDVSSAHRQDLPYFRAIGDEMEAGGHEALLHTLLTWDLKGYEVRKIPQTDGLRDQKQLSFSPLQEWWHEKLERGHILPQNVAWEESCYCPELIEDFLIHARRHGARGIRRTGTSVEIGHFLKSAIPNLKRKDTADDVMIQIDGKDKMHRRPRRYVIPTLEDCRAHWDTQGGPWLWPEDDDIEPAEPTNVEKFAKEDPI